MRRILSIFSILILLTSCGEKVEKSTVSVTEVTSIHPILDTIRIEDGIRVRIIINDVAGNSDLILLPGWNFPLEHWSDSTGIIEIANENGWNLIMPEMGKSIYHQKIYPLTRADWSREKTVGWLTDTLFPRLNLSYGILDEERYVRVLGISTGGRGAMALVNKEPGLIDEVISLSGDYSTISFSNDNLYRGYFGELSENATIWKNEDLCKVPPQTKSKFILIHGEKDKIVPVEHSERLNDLLLSKNKRVQFLKDSSGVHNYIFWKVMIDSVLK